MFCNYCGATVPDSRDVGCCRACGREFGRSAMPATMSLNLAPVTAQAPAGAAAATIPPARTSYSPAQPVWQIPLLWVATLTFYQVYWFTRTWRQFNKFNGHRFRTGWRTVGLAVPLLGYALMLDTFDEIARLRQGLTAAPPFHSGRALLGLIVCNLLWFLPDPYRWLGLLGALPLMYAQRALNAYWLAALPQLPLSGGRRMLWWAVPGALWLALGGLLLSMVITAKAEVEAMSPWPEPHVAPAAAATVDLSHLALEEWGTGNVAELEFFERGWRYSRGDVVSYALNGEEIVQLVILRYNRSDAAEADFSDLVSWAESECGWSRNGWLDTVGAINCGFDDAHVKVVRNDLWLVWIAAYEGSTLSPEEMANAVRDALPAHWRILRDRSTSGQI